MRKLILTTAAVTAAIAGAFAAETVFGTFTDTRDGQTYKTVTIGIQAWVTVIIGGQTWMAENLNYKTDSSWCYKNIDSNCVKYGRLYNWNTAKTVCPNGWKLPSREDWNYLGQAVGGEKEPDDKGNIDWYGAGKKLKSKSVWNNRDDGSSGNGTNDYGFSALPGGGRGYTGGRFGNAGYYGFWWTATEGSDGSAYFRNMDYYNDNMGENNFGKSCGLSVRCVADTP
ncbi:MAG: fibrobacter succinogenes major paralogous domain-containing protein [Chitinispirillales bacterium]|jgi:uncharacterized protein (TIGR02145 family)|nr:fibrobacter succinogenes major paralogous domain-containing protein [Chitinispirillales bacterium]